MADPFKPDERYRWIEDYLLREMESSPHAYVDVLNREFVGPISPTSRNATRRWTHDSRRVHPPPLL